MLITIALSLSAVTNVLLAAVSLTSAKREPDAPKHDLAIVYTFGAVFTLVAILCALALFL